MGLHTPEPQHRQRDPFEIMFSAVMLISTLVQLGFGAVPGSLALLLPSWARIAWLLTVLVGCVAVLVGVFWRDAITGMFIESVGLSAVSMSIITYSLGIFVVTADDGGRGVLSAALTLMFGVAFGWKYVQLRAAIRRLPT